MLADKRTTAVSISSISPTPLGPVWVAVSRNGLWALEYDVAKETFIQLCQQRGGVEILEDDAKVAQALQEIAEYLEGSRAQFTSPIDWMGMTGFQIKVRKAVMNIPYGQTSTYGHIAAQIGRRGAARAVGRANAANPIPFVIPCHRVVGVDGNLRGYGGAGGIETKRWLLELERSNVPCVSG